MKPEENWTPRVLGKPLMRPEAQDKARGASVYAGDVKRQRLLHGKILHSPLPHARIRNIDTSRALRLPGVKGVVTGRDIAPVRIGRFIGDRTAMAIDKVLYVGEFVAAVAAVDEETAQEALELIQVDYEELPAVFDPEEALRDDAPILHPDLPNYRDHVRSERRGNIRNHSLIRNGDVDQAMAQAYLIHEESYSTQSVHAGFIEPRVAMADPDVSGKLTVWASAKGVFMARSAISEVLGIPPSYIRVISPVVGGDFGGKGSVMIDPICALLARVTNQPVRLALTRAEELSCTYGRHPSASRLKVGVAQDGTLLAARGRIVYDCGAYSDAAAGISPRAAFLSGPYRYQAVDLEGYCVYTNNPPRGHVRAPGSPQPHFAIESHLDTMAAMLGIDPLEMRIKNLVQDGDYEPGAKGTLTNVGLGDTVEAIRRRMDRSTDRPGRAWGVACGQLDITCVHPNLPASAAIVRLNQDGTVTLQMGVVETGGGQFGTLRQIAAEELGLRPEDVWVLAGDSELVAHEEGTGSSATMFRAGNSVREAARHARELILRRAADQLEADPADLEIADGQVMVRGVPDRALKLSQLAGQAIKSAAGPIVGTGMHLRQERAEHHQRLKGIIDAPCYGIQAAEVEVDRETGQVNVLRFLAAEDVGFALNPARVEEQLHGAVGFGIGFALRERLVVQNGKVLNTNLTDYKMSGAPEIPPIETFLIEKPSTTGPYGSKGVGEPPGAMGAPAIANAIFAATGARVRELPMTPERVLAAIREVEAQNRATRSRE